ncbi:hypothetical protein [Paenibacillus sp. LK1]|uniref:hypothetical protein n=1 Tax=Paenibacillus sp. LK1 TaxID=2053014 RepID=UPI000C1A23A8|nr:hypothetical protein [Paenibacillus sp. LK1]PIH59097.1 hypothetical protein CS562_14245 [Paenibacillus sp. LK1]
MKLLNKIVVRDYHYSCSDGCCSEWGTELIVNEKLVGTFTDVDEDVVRNLLEALNVEFELEYIYDHQD